MRKHTIYLQRQANDNDNDDSCRTRCTFYHYQVSLPSTANKDYEFSSSVWKECTADNGGGIYLSADNDSSINLTVNKGEFVSCKAYYRGGGIYIQGIGDITVQNTLFYKDIAEAKDGLGGGGIEIVYPLIAPEINDCSFLLCKTGDDAGGIGFWYSSVFQHSSVKRCRFVECIINKTFNSGGGGIILWWCKAAIGCSECIFSKCHSDFFGGALCFDIESSETFSEIPIVSFCFFNANTAMEKCGNDVFFVEWIPDEPILQSLSTSSSYCISVAQSYGDHMFIDRYTHPDNWLPQGTLSLNIDMSMNAGTDIILKLKDEGYTW